ncbi:hypothetical protein DOK_08609 [gamma proteobacterium BDW918]|nr:hypothetical protein DOK_08609 [gamma proteobacterium BDW918]
MCAPSVHGIISVPFGHIRLLTTVQVNALCPDFKTILAYHGFTPDNYDFEQAVVGLAYDIDFALHEARSCFDISKTVFRRRPWELNSMLAVDLWLLPGLAVNTGVTFLYQKWVTELRYQKPVVEQINTSMSHTNAHIRVLMISDWNAITIELRLNAVQR